MEAKRYDKKKIRHDLLPAHATNEVAKVFTFGANKYGDRNWEKGMEWSRVIGSLKRHINAIEQGIDYDDESNMLHAAHAGCNILMLLEYYKIHPELDNRNHQYNNTKRIALDIDEVLADWIGHWSKHHQQEVPETWNFDRDIKSKFDLLKNNKDFWLSIPTKTKPEDINFEPWCYITSRNIPNEWSEEWIDKNGFPTMPVYTVGHGNTKVDVCKEQKIDIFVDDRFENFRELNNAGIFCYLFDAPHNKRYNVGHKRIYSLKEIY